MEILSKQNLTLYTRATIYTKPLPKDKPQDNLAFGKEFSSGFSPALFQIFPNF